MRLTNLTDQEIQQYLDGTVSPGDRIRIERRLKQEPGNAGLLDDYGILYDELAQCEVPPLSRSFMDSVMERIETIVPIQPKPQYGAHPVILLALLAGISIIVYFLNPLNVVSILGSLSIPDGWALPNAATVLALIEILQTKTTEVSRVVPYIGASAAAMICLTILEHMLLRPQLKRV